MMLGLATSANAQGWFYQASDDGVDIGDATESPWLYDDFADLWIYLYAANNDVYTIPIGTTDSFLFVETVGPAINGFYSEIDYFFALSDTLFVFVNFEGNEGDGSTDGTFYMTITGTDEGEIVYEEYMGEANIGTVANNVSIVSMFSQEDDFAAEIALFYGDADSGTADVVFTYDAEEWAIIEEESDVPFAIVVD